MPRGLGGNDPGQPRRSGEPKPAASLGRPRHTESAAEAGAADAFESALVARLARNLGRLIELYDDGNLNAAARRIGVPQPTLYKIVSGERQSPSLGTVARLARGYRLTVSELIGETKPETSATDESWLRKLHELLGVATATVEQALPSDVELDEGLDEDEALPRRTSHRGGKKKGA